MPRFTEQALYDVASLIVQRMGSAPEEALEVADHLVRANLTGHDSHGVGMLPAYVRLLKDGLLVPNQTLETVLEDGALLVVDARRGFGQRMAAEAVRRAIERARTQGACVLALRNSAHIGRVGTYGELAAAAGMVFTSYVNVADHEALQAPWGAAMALLGTNPFCAAVPAPDGDVVLDMATTTIAAGKARVARNKGVPVPPGALIDAEGRPTDDPTGFIDRHEGALLSFGRHKGSGLAVMCELMASAVAGGQSADAPPAGGILNSMLAVVIDLQRLGGSAEMAGRTRDYIRGARRMPDTEAVLLPGDPERRSTAARRTSGIEVDEATWKQIVSAAGRLAIEPSELAAPM